MQMKSEHDLAFHDLFFAAMQRALAVETAFSLPADCMTHRQIDDARCTLGREKLRIRLDRPPIHYDPKTNVEPATAATLAILKPYTDRLSEINRTQEMREAREAVAKRDRMTRHSGRSR